MARDYAEVMQATPTDDTHDVMQGAGPQTSVAKTSFFDMHEMPERALGADASTSMTIQALVNHAEDDGVSLLSVRHPAGDFTRPHSHNVPQIVFVVEGEVKQGSRVFGPGSGFFTPAGVRYSLKTGDAGCWRVEWRPSPLRFSTDWVDDSTPHVTPPAGRAPTAPASVPDDASADPERERHRRTMQGAGPLTSAHDVALFDTKAMPEVPVGDPERPSMWIQALVNPVEPDGCSLLGVRYPPHGVVELHRHDVAQVVLVIEGELRQGARVFRAGSGYFTPAGQAYRVEAGDDGVKVIEFRGSPLTFESDYSVGHERAAARS
jgi:quercetin dioxygenase-like cupin family protein